MSTEHGYSVLNGLNTPRIRSNLKLPYHIEELVGLNTNLTEKHLQLGGVATLTIKSDNEIKEPVIVGISKSGEALAGLYKTAAVSSENNKINSGLPKSASWSDLTININEISSVEMLRRNNKDIQDPKNWVPILDSSIKDGIASASFENLIKRSNYHIILNTITVSWSIFDLKMHNYINLIYAALLWHGYARFKDNNDYGTEKPGKGKRLSLATLEFPELDRMAIQSLSLPFAKFVKKINR